MSTFLNRSRTPRMGFVQTENPLNRSLAARWGSDQLFEEGFLGVPAAFLKSYTRLGITSSQAMFILQLMSFKWTESAPFPSYKTLSERMGITTEMARKHAKGLEEKGLLARVRRHGQSNAFDLKPLALALEQATLKSAA